MIFNVGVLVPPQKLHYGPIDLPTELLLASPIVDRKLRRPVRPL